MPNPQQVLDGTESDDNLGLKSVRDLAVVVPGLLAGLDYRIP